MWKFLCLVTLGSFLEEVTAAVLGYPDGLFDERIQFDFGVIFFRPPRLDFFRVTDRASSLLLSVFSSSSASSVAAAGGEEARVVAAAAWV